MAELTLVAPDIACAEAIAFMHLLHAVPAEPSINLRQQCVDSNPAAYSLPFARERDLVNTLAFLSNIGEDPNHIPALCIHEMPTGELKVIIAVNQAHHGDGRSTLNDIRNGFQRIFHSLSRVSETPGAEEAVFSDIVVMCSLRIRERMRYAPHKRNRSRQTIKQLLEETSALLGGKCPEFRQKAKTVIKFVDSWVKHQTEQRLCDLIEALLQLSRISNLPQMLSSISNTRMGPSERKNLLKMIRRVARYREAARFLYRTAKKYPLARRMKIVLFSLPETAFRRLPIEHQPNFLVACARLQIAHGHRPSFTRAARLLRRDGQTAEDLFAKQCNRTLSEGKVHAEMQLIYYLETQRPELTPRVVASSKMACFLCNTFLCQVTKLYTKRCHGRLYPAWKLPIFPPSCTLESIFVQTLESYIRTSITTLLSRQRRTIFPQPSESTLWTMEVSATTVNMISGRAEGMKEPLSPESSASRSRQFQQSPPVATASERKPAAVERRDASVSAVASPCCLELLTLQQGNATTVALGAPSVAAVQAGPLLVQLEYTVGENGGVRSKLKCSLEWLTREDADAVKDDKMEYIVDAETLDSVLTIPASNLQAFCIATSGSLTRLEIGRGVEDYQTGARGLGGHGS